MTIERERMAFDQIAGKFNESLVLFGAGALGKLVLRQLRRNGLEPLSFADNNPAIAGSSIDGLPVLSAADAIAKFRERACFVVTIYNGSPVRRQLHDQGCTAAPFAPLFWKYADAFIPQQGIELPHRLLAHADDIEECYELLADELSKAELVGQMHWRYALDYGDLPRADLPARMHHPEDLIAAKPDEVFADCGAFDGDSLRAFLTMSGNQFKKIYCIEPDPANRRALAGFIDALDPAIARKIRVLPYALGSVSGQVTFAAAGDVTSRIGAGATDNSNCITIECRPLGEIASEPAPTYIKMDIEGAEPDAILGCSKILHETNAVLSACTYHRAEHLWEIPRNIHSLRPDYKIFLRRYAEDCWEGVCYGVPIERLKSTGAEQ